MYTTHPLLLLSTNYFDEHDVFPGPQFKQESFESHCLFTALFKPTPALEAKAQAAQEALLGAKGSRLPYVAVHLRMGHLDGEMGNINRGYDHFQVGWDGACMCGCILMCAPAHQCASV